MIYSRLEGGLGNQMFQYAIARSLSLKNKIDFKLDLSWFSTSTKRKYELHVLNIKEKIASQEEIINIVNSNKKFPRFINGILKKKYIKYYYEPLDFSYDPEVIKLDNVCLIGYWQSLKYFISFRDILLGEFTLKQAPNEKNKSFLEQIIQEESVAIHVRRGDYISESKTNTFHGVQGKSYYKQCMEIIEKKIRNPHYFVFSDDIDWTKDNIKSKFQIEYITGNNEKGWEDLRLMKNAKHFIIANSSFSWWGAWLSRNHNKVVIAPKRWIQAREVNFNDFIPNTWITL